MMRESFVFYESFHKSIALLQDDAVELELYRAICDYGLHGTEPILSSSIAQALWACFLPQLEANNKRYLNGCKGAESGKLGGRPSSKANPNKTPTKPQQNPTATPNDNVNGNDNANDNDNNVSGNHSDPPENENMQISDDEKKFNDWLEKNFNDIFKMKQPLTLSQYKALCERHGKERLMTKMEAYCNTKYKNKTFVSAYKTLHNWCKKDY